MFFDACDGGETGPYILVKGLRVGVFVRGFEAPEYGGGGVPRGRRGGSLRRGGPAGCGCGCEAGVGGERGDRGGRVERRTRGRTGSERGRPGGCKRGLSGPAPTGCGCSCKAGIGGEGGN